LSESEIKCDGSRECRAEIHVHGCFSERPRLRDPNHTEVECPALPGTRRRVGLPEQERFLERALAFRREGGISHNGNDHNQGPLANCFACVFDYLATAHQQSLERIDKVERIIEGIEADEAADDPWERLPERARARYRLAAHIREALAANPSEEAE